ncbi:MULTISPECIES: hypothetical protein [unclassified Kitasatospora]|uniref:hypothetical protein n=1 Tax=unclassified Kitasatospora TaxID=2633591 RepID=UPI00070B28C5|nr:MULTISPECIES: hypothetical protein [unclassified Kitasatospora]KQV21277.1 hypothetical protein ASC99_19825 [Kitasatospora sp. Root107]KRB69466.1 hypothetical protein ASE03_27260 [Kitasatospora sp. Root187]
MAVNSLAGAVRSTGAGQGWLRKVLALDAVVTGGNGLAYLAFSGPLGELLGIDRMVLLDIGAFLLLFGAGVGFLASRREPSALAVKALVDANVVWSVLSIVAMVVRFEPSTAGLVWIPMQAATVAGFAALQWLALRPAARSER